MDQVEKCIVHLDMDCFYAQVEEVRLKYTGPLAVRQKGLLVTCNYAARAKGLRKCIPTGEGRQLCPDLLIVPGEDLHPYRRASANVAALLQSYNIPAEKLGLDETYLDVTELVDSRLNDDNSNTSPDAIGNISSYSSTLCLCPKNTHNRLRIATHIADEIRTKIKLELGLTCCAGIAHNKLLAKLVGATHKPNQQTLIYPCSAQFFMATFDCVKSIPGVGTKMYKTLLDLNIKSVLDLQNYSSNILYDALGSEVGNKFKNLSKGIDTSLVKQSGRSTIIGLEDSFKNISTVKEVEEKFEILSNRLIELMQEDGRRPGGLRITIQKKGKFYNEFSRQTRQCDLSPSLFLENGGKFDITDRARKTIFQIVMKLFCKSVDTSKLFNICLLGLAFTKFKEMEVGKNSITNYLSRVTASVSVLEPNFQPLQPTEEYDHSISSSEPPSKRACIKIMHTLEDQDKIEKKQSQLPTKIDNSDAKSYESTIPDDIDKDVFAQLPSDLQKELYASWSQSIRLKMLQSKNKCSSKSEKNSITKYLLKNN